MSVGSAEEQSEDDCVCMSIPSCNVRLGKSLYCRRHSSALSFRIISVLRILYEVPRVDVVLDHIVYHLLINIHSVMLSSL